MMKHYFKFIALITITLILASCASKPSYSPAGVREADQLYLTKQYSKAAIAYTQQASGTKGKKQTLLLLRAVIAFVKAEQLPQALLLFHSIKINERDRKQSNLARLTRAHIAFAERDAKEVLLQLKKPFYSKNTAITRAEYHELRASAFSMQGDRLTTAEEYVKQGKYLKQDDAILNNQHLIWQSLTLLSERSLRQMQPGGAPDVLSGWMELVRLSKKYQLNPVLLRTSIKKWQRRYTKHPAHLSLLEGLRNRKQEDVALPKNIALLLPLSGRYASAAKAIRDGLFASYYSKKDKKNIIIRTYDTKGKPKNIESIYEKAVSEGAQFVIGPLNKKSIKKLVEEDTFSVPTLALNYIDSEGKLPEELFQFGLSPEEEAIQVAERTWLDGHVNAAVLTPTGSWGDRVHKAFRKRWEQFGGRIVEQQSYNSTKNDYAFPIRKLFNIDESKIRYRNMKKILKTKIKYTSYRRQDIDFIFIAGFPRQARQIRPSLKFYHASKLPVYATSHIFTGNLNPARDRLMDGIRFGDMPWVLSDTTSHRGLRNQIESLISKEGHKHQRFYAMGVDAFKIIAVLNTLKTYPYERYQGETGSLSMDENQHLKRQLSWVFFRSGRPILLEQASQ